MSSTSDFVKGPNIAVDNSLTRFNGVTGKVVKGSNSQLDDLGNLSVSGLSVSGINYPYLDGSAGQSLTTDGNGMLKFKDVLQAPSVSIDKSLVRFDGTTGKIVQGSKAILNDSGALSVASLKSSGIQYPLFDGIAGQSLVTDGLGNLSFTEGSGGGDVLGPSSSISGEIPRFNDDSGKILTNSNVFIDDSSRIISQGLHVGNLEYPVADGSSGQILSTDGLGNLSFVDNLSVQGPALSNDKAVARYDGVSGQKIQDSLVTISDSGQLQTQFLTVGALLYPNIDGLPGQLISTDGSGNLSFVSSGDVSGPVSSTDSGIARYDGVSGKLIKDSSVIIDDSGKIFSQGLQTASINYPSIDGSSGQVLSTDGSGNLSFVSVSQGDTIGPSSSTDSNIVRFDGVTGKLIKDSTVNIDDTGLITASSAKISNILYPSLDGSSGQVLSTDGSGNLGFVSVSQGDVSSSTTSDDQAVVRFDGTTGKLIKNSLASIDDSGLLTITSLKSSGLSYPISDGTTNQAILTDGSGNLSFGNVGDISTTINSSLDSSLVRFDGVSGKLIKDSNSSLDDSGKLSIESLSASGLLYPISDGSQGQILTTDGSGNLFFSDKGIASNVFLQSFGTLSLSLTSNYSSIPGILQSFTLSKDCIVCIVSSTKLSSSTGNRSVGSVRLIIDNVGTNPVLFSTNGYESISISSLTSLTAGLHTIDLQARIWNGGPVIVNDDSTPLDNSQGESALKSEMLIFG